MYMMSMRCQVDYIYSHLQGKYCNRELTVHCGDRNKLILAQLIH